LIYRYFFSNKLIQSDIKWPFLPSSTSKSTPDINISLDKSIFPKKDINNSRDYYVINMKKSIIHLKNKAYIEISDSGKKISVNIFQDKIDDTLSYKIANQIIPYSVYMQGGFVLHASCITALDGCILFVGRSGTGKSTLASSFLDKKILSEDFVSLEESGGDYLAYPTIPFSKISSNIITKFGLNNSKNIKLDNDFRARNLVEINNFEHTPKKVLHCFFLNWGDRFSISPLPSHEKISHLLESTYNAFPLGSCPQSSKNIFNKISEFIRRVKVSKIARKKDLDFSNNQNILDSIS